MFSESKDKQKNDVTTKMPRDDAIVSSVLHYVHSCDVTAPVKIKIGKTTL